MKTLTFLPKADYDKVTTASQYFAEHADKEYEWLHDSFKQGILDEISEKRRFFKHWESLLESHAFSQTNSIDQLKKILRIYKRRELLRLIWRFVIRKATLQEVMQVMTWIAEITLQYAVAWLHQTNERLSGVAYPELMVIALGKLGGEELNLSSDIDLMFVFSSSLPDAETYYLRCARQLVMLLEEQTPDGYVFRVDLRLRPFGDAGPLVIRLSALEDYYQTHGREWERYALIKARTLTGSPDARNEFAAMIKPFVYRRYLDYSVLESLREMKLLIIDQIKLKSNQDDIKLGAGGIREIEFIVQALQLIHGGKNPLLQTHQLHVALETLQQEKLLTKSEAENLQKSYLFLRNLEHAIQAFNDEQIHRIPDLFARKAAILIILGYRDWESLLEQLNKHREYVTVIFSEKIVSVDGTQPRRYPTEELLLWCEQETHEQEAIQFIETLGFSEPEAIYQQIFNLLQYSRAQKISQHARARFKKILPMIWQKALNFQSPQSMLNNIYRIVQALLKRSNYLVLLYENDHALEHLLTLCYASPWFAEQICQHPLLLDEFLVPERLFKSVTDLGLAQQISAACESLKTKDLEEQMDQLRILKHIYTLRIAACDVTGQLSLEEVSHLLTVLAESFLRSSVELAIEYLINRNIEWRNLLNRLGNQLPFAIVSFGTFAGRELSYHSDLDVVFLYDKEDLSLEDKDIIFDFCLRLTQRVVHLLSTQTTQGVLYPLDMQLRPSGQAGLLVTSFHAFFEYEFNEAWTWEHQAIVRSRCVYGDNKISKKYHQMRNSVLTLHRDMQILKDDVLAMRHKMLKARPIADLRFHLKHDAGGMIDIEFIVQYLVLRWACQYHTLLDYTDNVSLLLILSREGILSAESGEHLIKAYEAFRMEVHRLALQDHEPIADAQRFAVQVAQVKNIWHLLFE